FGDASRPTVAGATGVGMDARFGNASGHCRKRGLRVKALVNVLGPLLGLIGVVILFALLTGSPEHYLSTANLRVVLAQTVIVAIAAIGMTMIIISGGIDLSVGSVIALASVITAVLLRAGYSPITATLAGIATGGIIGVINGLAITRLRVVPFIAP